MSRFSLVVVASTLLIVVGAVVACPIPAQLPAYQASCYAPQAQQVYYAATTTYCAPTYLAYPVTLQVAIPTVTVPAQLPAQQPPVPAQLPAQQPPVPAQLPAQQPAQVPMAPAQEVQVQPQAQAVIVQKQVAAYYAAPQAAVVMRSFAYAAPQAAVGYNAVAVQRNVVVAQRSVVVAQKNVVVQRNVVVARRAPAQRVVIRQVERERTGLLGRLFAGRSTSVRSSTRIIVR